MTQDQYLAICEQVCRNLVNRLEELELYAEPTVSEYQEFHMKVRDQLRGYQDALERLVSEKRIIS